VRQIKQLQQENGRLKRRTANGACQPERRSGIWLDVIPGWAMLELLTTYGGSALKKIASRIFNLRRPIILVSCWTRTHPRVKWSSVLAVLTDVPCATSATMGQF